ncbi:MAG: hypothetical protein PHT92_12420 [Bacteroidales bacterium]|nr:hypothetical protein [Bacteroidales bacterium]
MKIELAIILLLIAYIAYLHFKLKQKENRIDSLLNQQLSLQNFSSREEIDFLIDRLKSFPYETLLKPNKLLDGEVQNFLFSNLDNEELFVHYTRDQEVADTICREGFQFADSFYKTAEPITNDKLDLVYKHNLRKQFGSIIVVLAFSKDIYNKYTQIISNVKAVVNVEQIFSTLLPELNDNLDEVYLLPAQFVKGYINIETGEIVPNLNFKPTFDSPDFEKNIRELQGG